jgi:hypothetical protein
VGVVAIRALPHTEKAGSAKAPVKPRGEETSRANKSGMRKLEGIRKKLTNLGREDTKGILPGEVGTGQQEVPLSV